MYTAYHASKNWKIGLLKAILYRAYKVCSNIKLQAEELKGIKTTFHDINEYPLHIINRAIQDIEDGTANQDKEKTHSILCLPYKGDRGHRLLNALRRKIKENGDINIQLAYTGKKLRSEFQCKDSTDFAHTHNVVYGAICPSDNCGKRYIGETGRRLSVRAKEHLGEKSHLGQHTIRTGHRPVTLNDF